MTEQTKEDIIHSWIEYTDSFFDLVKLGCEEVDNPRHSNKFIEDIKIEHKDKINIAVIYNMKHAIELMLKTLIKIMDVDDNVEISKLGHDLNNIFKELKTYTTDTKKMDNIFRLSGSTDQKIITCVKQEFEEITKGMLKNLNECVDYYNRFKFLSIETLDTDTVNTVFRYPEGKPKDDISIKVRNESVFFTYGNLDTERIQKDVELLSLYLFRVKSIFDVYYQSKVGTKIEENK
jgi:uncharacterized protein (UPF0335 family)